MRLILTYLVLFISISSAYAIDFSSTNIFDIENEISSFSHKKDLFQDLSKKMTIDALFCEASTRDIASLAEKDVSLLKVNVKVTGELSPISIHKIVVDLEGTTDVLDLNKIKIYYSGNVNQPILSNQFGVAKQPKEGINAVSAFQELKTGDNYFWIVADIAANATINNNISARCSLVIADDDTRISKSNSPIGTLLISEKTDYSKGLTLWYDSPASNAGKESWKKETRPNYGPHRNPDQAWSTYALPIGNGSIGGMVYGHIEEERIQFNEKTLWTGGPGSNGYSNPNVTNAHQQMGAIREALINGNAGGAESLSKQNLRGKFSGDDNRFGKYQTFGEIQVKTGITENGITNYQRALSLENGTIVVSFTKDETTYKREYLCSYPDKVMVMQFSSNKPGKQNLEFRIKSPHPHSFEKTSDGILLKGNVADNNLGIAARTHVSADGGVITIDDNYIKVTGANSVTFRMAADTEYKAVYPTYRGEDPYANTLNTIASVKEKSFSELKSAHLQDYQKLFKRVSLEINNSASLENIPTDDRLNAYKRNQSDKGLEVLYYQYGRYMLIASSRGDNLPANLQGIWNNELYPAWLSDYHLNINLQMNYWGVETSNLSECHTSLIDYIDDLRVPGAETAKAYHNARGWTAHVHSNIWGFTAPSNYGVMFWQYFPMASAWLSQHAWEHYDFTRDKTYLRNQGYPMLKDQAHFIEDYLFKYQGEYVSMPSWSPEHGSISKGTTADHAMAWDLLNNTIEASEALDIDVAERAKWKEIRDQIRKPKIGKWGQLMEWYDDLDTQSDKHRHINHLYGLYPGRQISPVTTPEWAAAANKTLTARGDGATGWSMGWKINFWARSLDGDHAYILIKNLLRNGTSTNLFDMHPPFQIDGNLGGMAGFSEMLLQSQSGFIHLLPALPSAWSSGHVKGLVARGNFELDIKWGGGKFTNGAVTSNIGGECVIKYKEHELNIATQAGVTYPIRFDGTNLVVDEVIVDPVEPDPVDPIDPDPIEPIDPNPVDLDPAGEVNDQNVDQLEEIVTLYPNPTSGSFTIDLELNNKSDVTIEVFSVTGQKIYAKILRDTMIINENCNLSHVSNGIYFVKVATESKMTRQKIIITN